VKTADNRLVLQHQTADSEQREGVKWLDGIRALADMIEQRRRDVCDVAVCVPGDPGLDYCVGGAGICDGDIYVDLQDLGRERGADATRAEFKKVVKP